MRGRSSMTTILAVVALCIIVLAVHEAHALTVKVEPNREECFYETVEQSNVKVMLQYQVSAGGFLDVDLSILGPSGHVIHRAQRESEGKFTFNADMVGQYKFCFSNMMSTLTPKTVSFNIAVGDLLDPNLAKLEQLDPIEKSIMRLSEGLAQIQNEQKYLRMRERAHRDLVEDTNSRVLMWSIFEVVILVGVSVFQVLYLRRFVEVKRTV